MPGIFFPFPSCDSQRGAAARRMESGHFGKVCHFSLGTAKHFVKWRSLFSVPLLPLLFICFFSLQLYRHSRPSSVSRPHGEDGVGWGWGVGGGRAGFALNSWQDGELKKDACRVPCGCQSLCSRTRRTPRAASILLFPLRPADRTDRKTASLVCLVLLI